MGKLGKGWSNVFLSVIRIEYFGYFFLVSYILFNQNDVDALALAVLHSGRIGSW